MRQLDRDSSETVSQQIAAAIREAIRTGEIPPDGRIPSGAALRAHFRTSNVTVHMAIRMLKDEGLLVGRQGLGVFVRAGTVADEQGQEESASVKERLTRIEESLARIEQQLAGDAKG